MRQTDPSMVDLKRTMLLICVVSLRRLYCVSLKKQANKVIYIMAKLSKRFLIFSSYFVGDCFVEIHIFLKILFYYCLSYKFYLTSNYYLFLKLIKNIWNVHLVELLKWWNLNILKSFASRYMRLLDCKTWIFNKVAFGFQWFIFTCQTYVVYTFIWISSCLNSSAPKDQIS